MVSVIFLVILQVHVFIFQVRLFFILIDAIQTGWNIMIDGWNLPVIGQGHVSAGPRRRSPAPRSLLHRLWFQTKSDSSPTSGIFWHHFCTVGGIKEASSIFIYIYTVYGQSDCIIVHSELLEL